MQLNLPLTTTLGGSLPSGNSFNSTIERSHSFRTILKNGSVGDKGLARFPAQVGIHVAFVNFDAGLAVGVNANQATFDHGGQHQHLIELAQAGFV